MSQDWRDRRRVEERDGRTIIREGDNRVIIREGDREVIRHDEIERLRRGARDVDVVTGRGGDRTVTVVRPDGSRIITMEDADGNLMRRIRRTSDGRDVIIIDNSRRPARRGRGGPGFYPPPVVSLPPLVLGIPRERYIVEAEEVEPEIIEETLMAPPVEEVERAYSLDEIRYNERLREKMRRVDIDTINFAFGSAEIGPSEVGRLDAIARALAAAIRRDPNEVFLVEGHTDAVGADTDNLALSDRRAEAVAAALTETYDIPPENLVTQGYGEQYLKVRTDGPERENRRVSLRRITPLMSQNAAPPAQ
jgi:outer membrane protein OmpA-like peptidoglycan-associated protein